MKDIKLNPEQKLATEHVQGPLLVLAGAGSGKTSVVTNRIAHLIKIGVPASEILALTFTNKAADEMRERIKKLTNFFVWTSTFHSLCARILKESIHHLGFKNDFSIYDAHDSEQVIKACLKSLGINLEKSLIKSLKSAISTAKNNLQDPAKIVFDLSNPGEVTFKQIFSMYQDKLKEYNALDFDDLLYLTVKLFQKHPLVLKNYQQKWTFLLIDEYQDTNESQYKLAKLLVGKQQNIFAVGDPDQSIYSWRGANISNILNFENDFPGAKVINLEQNYRSTCSILNAANALITNNEHRYEKKLWSDLGQGEKPTLTCLENDFEEVRHVIKTLRTHMHDISLDECAIFYRTNFQSRILEDALLKAKIPYVIIGGISFYQRREIKDIIAFLKLLVSPYDYISFARTINIPKRGFGPTTLQKLNSAAQTYQMSIIDLCYGIFKGEITSVKLSQKQRENLSEYCQAYDSLKKLIKNVSLKKLIQMTIESFNYMQHLKDDPDTYEERKSNVEELLSKSIEYSDDNPNHCLVTFLEELSLKASSEERKNNGECIKLMTLHNSKGLEFTLVIIVGLEEDLLPHINSKNSVEDIEEERRLLYVGMTRAKKWLYLSYSRYRLIWGSTKTMYPSQFLREIPKDLLNQEEDIQELADQDSLNVGLIVNHKNFGDGVIKRMYNTSLGPTVDVYFFDTQTTRTLVTKYAKFSVKSTR